jgi:hypothetical protein|nr:MAG TPA: hypothetical protein [Caudoviricetes sp.]
MTVTIKRTKKPLREKLLGLPLSLPVVIKSSDYTTVFVRRVAKELGVSGHDFKVTERGIVNGIQVTRLR